MKLQAVSNPTSNWIARLITSLVVLALVVGALPQPARAASVQATVVCAQKYTVASGDTITKIATSFSVTVTELANANDLKDPYTIFVGQVLCIPGSSTSTTTTTTGTTTASGLTLAFKDDSVVIKVASFPKKAIYYVKVKSARRGNDDPYVKIGRIKTTKTGTGSVTLRLPRSLRDATFITVCLKNAIDDTVKCENIRR